MNNWLHNNEHLVVFGILIVDIIMTAFIILEYFYGRPDVALKNERNQQRRMRVKKEVIILDKEMD